MNKIVTDIQTGIGPITRNPTDTGTGMVEAIQTMTAVEITGRVTHTLHHMTPSPGQIHNPANCRRLAAQVYRTIPTKESPTISNLLMNERPRKSYV